MRHTRIRAVGQLFGIGNLPFNSAMQNSFSSDELLLMVEERYVSSNGDFIACLGTSCSMYSTVLTVKFSNDQRIKY